MHFKPSYLLEQGSPTVLKQKATSCVVCTDYCDDRRVTTYSRRLSMFSWISSLRVRQSEHWAGFPPLTKNKKRSLAGTHTSSSGLSCVAAVRAEVPIVASRLGNINYRFQLSRRVGEDEQFPERLRSYVPWGRPTHVQLLLI